MKIGVIARYLILVISILIYVGSCSSDVMNAAQKSGLVPDDYRFGDLYRMASLPQFKARQIACPPAHPATAPRHPIHLYIIGDSFSEPPRMTVNDFPVASFKRIKWDAPERVQLDTTKTNILILETVERHFRDHFEKHIDELNVVSDTTKKAEPETKNRLSWQQITKAMETLFSRDAVEGRLETILFFSDWALWFKDLKAALTLNWFGRVNPKTTLSPDGKHLLYYLDTDTSLTNSSFKPISDQLLHRYIDSINTTADRYQKAGFDQVYLSIIPNKTSIYAPGMGPLPYNHLIERVQQSPRLTVPAIDVYTPYTASRIPLYEISDAHWNCDGRMIWMREVNKKLNAIQP